MSDYSINIKLDPSGAVSGGRTATRSLEQIDKAAENVTERLRGADGRFLKVGDSAGKLGVQVRSVAEAASVASKNLGGLDKSTSNLASAAVDMAAGFTAAYLSVETLKAFTIGSMQANRQFEKSLSDLSAITGATGDQLAYLKAQAQEIGASTSLSASQAAEAFKLIASAKPDLLESSAALNEVTRAAVTLAEAAGTSLPDAANTLGSALNQFGASADEAGRYINVLAAGSKYGAAEVTDVAESLKVAGVSAASANVSFEETNAAIQALAAVSIKGSEAGTALRNVILKLETDSNSKLRPSVVGLTGALQELGRMNEDTAALTKRFGLENINAAQALLNNVDNVEKLTGQLTGTTTAYDQASIRTNNLDGDMKELSSAVEALSLSIGEKLNPAARESAQLMTIAANAAATWLDSLGEAPTTLDGAKLKLAGLYHEMERLKGIQDEQTKKYGGVGFVAALFGDTDPGSELERVRKEAMALQDIIANFQGRQKPGVSPTQAKQAAIPAVASAPTTSAEGQKAIETLQQQLELAKLSGEARARLAAIQKLGTSATAEEKAEAEQLAAQIYRLDEAQKAATKSASEQAKTAEELKRQQEANSATVERLTQQLELASLSGAELAARQAELSLNEYATPAQVEQVRQLATAITAVSDAERARDEFKQLTQQLEDPLAKLERERMERLAIIQRYEELETASHSQAEAARAEIERQYNEERMAAVEEMFRQQSWGNELLMDTIDSLGAASTNVISGLLSGTMSVTEAMQNFANIVLNSVVGAFVDLGVEYIKNQVLASTTQATQTAMAVATGTAMASAYAPAAAMASLASFGANAAPASAGIASTVATSQALALTGFQTGGYTGDMGVGTVAGVVHGQEYVMNAEATRRIGVGNLERMASGGSVGGGVNVQVHNYATGTKVQTEQLDENTVRLIISDELDQQFPTRMAGELASDYSDSNSILSNRYSIQRNTTR